MRIIAKLDVKPPFVVKPVHFEGLRKMGKPDALAKKYYHQGADEIFYIDIVASLYQRDVLFDEIQAFSEDIFVPVAVGGGIRSIEDMSRLFHCGADKIVLNTFALQEKPDLIGHAVEMFGAQSVVVNIEAKSIDKNWCCYSDCGRIPSKWTVSQWVREVVAQGAGEILVQSVDKDGRKAGFDHDLIRKVVEQVDIPVVAASGAGSKEDVLALLQVVKPSGIALASLLHYDIASVEELRSFLRANGVEGI